MDLVSTLQEAVDTNRPAAENKGVTLEIVGFASSLPFFGDPDRIFQIVSNLVSNAIKFTPAPGKVSVSLTQNAEQVEVSVTDEGVGISPNFLPFVFEPFRQEDNSSTRQHGGLGLGLVIAKRLIELHGGSIHARSEGRGKGASFSVTLPLMIPPRSVSKPSWFDEPVSPSNVPLDLTGIRVLFVDDQPDALELFRDVFEQYHAEVFAVESARAALDLLSRETVDVLVSDLGLPEEDGYSFIRKLRARPEGATLPAVAVSGFVQGLEGQRALDAGFQICVAKPVEPLGLVTLVRDLAQGASSSSRGSRETNNPP
jgi:CheY-like chemotaxis protein